jgi:hypothetical protein
MFLRYRGGGVGHHSTRRATESFRKDRHPTDLIEATGIEDAFSPDGSSSDSDDTDVSVVSNKVRPGTGEDSDTEEHNSEREEDESSDVPLEWPESEDDEVEEPGEFADDGLGPEDGLGEGDEEEDMGYAAY